MLKLELNEAVEKLKKIHAKKILLQIPEGLKTKVDDIIEELESNGFDIAASMDPCFGACDLKENEAKILGCDAILHLGHSPFIEKTKIPTIYAFLRYDLGGGFEEISETLAKYLKKSGINSIGLTTTIQFIEYLPKLKRVLEKNKIKAVIGKGKRVLDGQVLGCNYSSAAVGTNTILFFGDGLFHPLGISFATGKKVITVNPFTKEIKELCEEKETFMRRRIMLIEKAKEAGDFGILVSTKTGQNRISLAKKIKELLELAGKKAKIYSTDTISESSLLGAKAEVLINTACPRIAFDDFGSFKQPILNSNEVGILLGKKTYDDYFIEETY
ncbi:MAG: diphthamide biosynthesis enzyme Dph2 [Candidatus Diapherotrites archaeon]|nr:diphthamide biosynthesis enzyme Dph2 [Candidatus Diapherotrites archaeon]